MGAWDLLVDNVASARPLSIHSRFALHRRGGGTQTGRSEVNFQDIIGGSSLAIEDAAVKLDNGEVISLDQLRIRWGINAPSRAHTCRMWLPRPIVLLTQVQFGTRIVLASRWLTPGSVE